MGGFGFIRAVTYRPRIMPDSRVLLIGDSFAQGLAVPMKALAEATGVPYIGSGIVASVLREWAASEWLKGKLADFRPTHVLVSLGTNDAFSNETPLAAAQFTHALAQKIRDAGAHPIWIGAPRLPVAIGTQQVNIEVLEAVRTAVDYYFDSSTQDIPRGPDGLHPTAKGYAGWAGAVWNWLS